jgi:hypothetical protein
VPFEYASVEQPVKRSGERMVVHRRDRTMDGIEERRRSFVAEAQRFFDCFMSIFILLLLMGPRQGLGSSLTAVGALGSSVGYGAATNRRHRLQKIVESVPRSSASCAGAELPSHGLQIQYAARRVAII